MKKQTNAKEAKKYIVHDGYIGTFQYFDKYALKEYGHIN